MLPHRHHSRNEPYFWGVALAVIVVGSGIFAVGCVEWLENFLISAGFHTPAYKIFAGLIVIALGYITMELELIRTQK